MSGTITTDILLLTIIIMLYEIGKEVATTDHAALWLCVASAVLVTIFSIFTSFQSDYLKELIT